MDEIALLHQMIEDQLAHKERPVAHFIVNAFSQLMRDIHTLAEVAEARARHESIPGYHQ